MPVHQLTPKSGSLDSSVTPVFIISTTSVILNISITIKNFELGNVEPDFAYLARRADNLSKMRRDSLPQTLDSPPDIL